MRHYKYRHDNRVQKQLLKERVNALNTNQRHNHKMTTRLFKVGFVTFTVIYVSFLVLSINTMNLYIENDVLQVVLIILLVFVGFIISALIMVPYFNFVEEKFPFDGFPRIIREMRIRSNQSYFNYYKINTDYIITKIYDSSINILTNKDVIIYFYNGKIRVTNDFTTSSFDFGCYEFNIDEIELSYDRTSDRLKTVLKTKDMSILLGKRAKPFISEFFSSYDKEKVMNNGCEEDSNN